MSSAHARAAISRDEEEGSEAEEEVTNVANLTNLPNNGAKYEAAV